MRTVEISTVRFERDERLLIATLLKGSRVNLHSAKEIAAARLEISAGDQMLVLVEGQENLKFDKAARDYLASEEGTRGILATALHIKSPVHYAIAHFFLLANKSTIPVKICYTREQGIEWLKTFLHPKD